MKNLLAIPVTVAEKDSSQIPDRVPLYAHGTLVWQGAYVLNVTLTEGLVLCGNITHAEEPGLQSTNYFITRSCYIHNLLHPVTDGLNKLDNFAFIKEIQLN